MRLGFSTACAIITGIATLTLLVVGGAHLSQGEWWEAAQVFALSALTGACTCFNWMMGED